MARLLHLAVAALSALALSTAAGSALADAARASAGATFVGCQVAIGTNEMTLPSNAPALLVNDTSRGATASVSVELVSADRRAPFGAPTRDAHGLLVVAFPETSAGSHTVATTTTCSNSDRADTRETSLILTAPAELPAGVGTITFRPYSPSTGGDRIVLEASPGLRAFDSVAVVELSVNGVVQSGYQAGGVAPDFQVNKNIVCVENGTVHREKRIARVSLAVHIAGVAESPAPATLDLPVDCAAVRWTSDGAFEPSGSDPDANDPGPSNAGSCSAAPSGLVSERSGIFAAATALALLASFRRRREASKTRSRLVRARRGHRRLSRARPRRLPPHRAGEAPSP